MTMISGQFLLILMFLSLKLILTTMTIVNASPTGKVSRRFIGSVGWLSFWSVENQGSQELVDAFRTFLADEYAARHYPSPPVAHIWEGYSPRWHVLSSSSNSCGYFASSNSSSSSVELPEGGVHLGAGGHADVVDGIGMIQRDSHAPSVFALLAGGGFCRGRRVYSREC